MFYEIVIEGYVKATRFVEFEIVKQANSTTVLRGDIVDQSALMGVLRAINDMGINLVSVNRLEKGISSKMTTTKTNKEDSVK